MKAVVAMDSFKGSLTSLQAGLAAAEGIRRGYPEAQVVVRPLADGGEGTVEALTEGMKGTRQQVTVTGPLGSPVGCEYGILPPEEKGGKSTAVMEMAGAAGLTLIPEEKRNPLITTTYGVGEMIQDAMEKGCRRFLIGIGGSATNDGGAGMLQALGFGLLDRAGKQIGPGATGLAQLCQITKDGIDPKLRECEFRIACDVTNPLCGPLGASAVFGPQKGAGPKQIREMDGWLARFAELAAQTCPQADPQAMGSGAAGGLGFAFRTFLHGVLEPGIEIVLKETRLEEYAAWADVVITGEGRLDGQTAMGKAPAGVAALAKKYGKPVLAFSGSVTPDAGACLARGIDAYFPIIREITTLQKAMEPAYAQRSLTEAVEQAFRLWRLSEDRGGNKDGKTG